VIQPAPGGWSPAMTAPDGPYAPTHKRLGFDEFDYGFTDAGIAEEDWRPPLE
jgi:hypothetical protein